MVVWYPWLINVFILFTYVCLCAGDNKKTEVPDSGPYKITLQDVKVCDSPSRPYMKNAPLKLEIVVVNGTNTTVMSGNYTVFRNAENVKHRLKGFIWENGKWKRNLVINEMGCHTMLMHFIATAMGVKYDRKKCMVVKGQYTFKNFDTNYVQHLWLSKMEYGKVMYRVESFIPEFGTLYCQEYYSVSEPA